MATKNAWNNTIAAANVSFTGGTMGIGTDATDNAINIGTAANTGRTITIGNTTGTSELDLRYGTGNFTLASVPGNVMIAEDTGEITYPLQPCFMAYNSTTRADVTGSGEVYTLIFDTERFDQNSDWDGTSTFTAPVTGKYVFHIVVLWLLQDALGANDIDLDIVTSNATYIWGEDVETFNERQIANFSMIVDMDAADTATFTITVDSTGASSVDIYGDMTQIRTMVSGELVT